jgi:probable F420-dependent oxidoreductase
MRFCIPFPFFPASHLLPMARAAEEAGFDSLTKSDAVFFPEHISARYHGSPDGDRYWPPDTPSVDPFVALAAIAAVTTSIGLTTNVVKLPIRDPLLVAKQLASLAVMSGERVSLGVGLSWVPVEFAFTRTDWRTRASRFEEMIEILRLACGGGGPRWIEHHGRHYQFDRLMISPSPQLPVPIIIGGHSDAAIRRAARIADGWVAGRLTADELVEAAASLVRYRREFGTDARPFEIAGQIVQKPDRALIAELEEAGVTELQVLPWLHYGGDPETLDTRVVSLYRFADEFITNRGEDVA